MSQIVYHLTKNEYTPTLFFLSCNEEVCCKRLKNSRKQRSLRGEVVLSLTCGTRRAEIESQQRQIVETFLVRTFAANKISYFQGGKLLSSLNIQYGIKNKVQVNCPNTVKRTRSLE